MDVMAPPDAGAPRFLGIVYVAKKGKYRARVRPKQSERPVLPDHLSKLDGLTAGYYLAPEDAAKAADRILHKLGRAESNGLLSAEERAEVDALSWEDLMAGHTMVWHSPDASGRPTSRGSSMFRGVAWNHSTQKWMSRIDFKNKQLFLGCYSSQEDAARAYDKAAHYFHGTDASLNFKSEVPGPPDADLLARLTGMYRRTAATARSGGARGGTTAAAAAPPPPQFPSNFVLPSSWQLDPMWAAMAGMAGGKPEGSAVAQQMDGGRLGFQPDAWLGELQAQQQQQQQQAQQQQGLWPVLLLTLIGSLAGMEGVEEEEEQVHMQAQEAGQRQQQNLEQQHLLQQHLQQQQQQHLQQQQQLEQQQQQQQHVEQQQQQQQQQHVEQQQQDMMAQVSQGLLHYADQGQQPAPGNHEQGGQGEAAAAAAAAAVGAYQPGLHAAVNAVAAAAAAAGYSGGGGLEGSGVAGPSFQAGVEMRGGLGLEAMEGGAGMGMGTQAGVGVQHQQLLQQAAGGEEEADAVWEAALVWEGHRVFLGQFRDEEELMQAYDRAVECLRASGARLKDTGEVPVLPEPPEEPASSSYRGVHLLTAKRHKKWQARITLKGRRVFLGCYSTEEEAARMYDRAAHYLHAKDARLNFKEEVPAPPDAELLARLRGLTASGSGGGGGGSQLEAAAAAAVAAAAAGQAAALPDAQQPQQ